MDRCHHRDRKSGEHHEQACAIFSSAVLICKIAYVHMPIFVLCTHRACAASPAQLIFTCTISTAVLIFGLCSVYEQRL